MLKSWLETLRRGRASEDGGREGRTSGKHRKHELPTGDEVRAELSQHDTHPDAQAVLAKTFQLLHDLRRDNPGTYIHLGPFMRRQSQGPIKDLDRGARADLLRGCIILAEALAPKRNPDGRVRVIDPNAPGYDWRIMMETVQLVMESAVRKKAELSPSEVLDLMEGVLRLLPEPQDSGFGMLARQLEWAVKSKPLGAEDIARVEAILSHSVMGRDTYYGSDMGKVQARLMRIIGADTPGTNPGDPTPSPPEHPVIELPSGKFSLAGRKSYAAADDAGKQAMNALFMIASAKFGAKPSNKAVTAMSEARTSWPGMTDTLLSWCQAASQPEAFVLQRPGSPYIVPDTPNAALTSLLKTLVWTLGGSRSPRVVPALRDLGTHMIESLPGHGPRSLGAGNAVIAVLGTKGLPGLAALTGLRNTARQPSLRRKIDDLIDSQAEAQGVSRTTLQEMAAPEHGLADGQRTWDMAGYTLTLNASEAGQAVLNWTKPDGGAMKSVPAGVKADAKLKAELAKARTLLKEVRKARTAQRDRLDGLYLLDASWSVADHRAAYLDHGLVGPLARRLIWWLHAGDDRTAALYRDGRWEDVSGTPVSGERVTLWHPIEAETDAVLAWRARLETLQLRQPFKQAHREIYPLTEAELNTRTYSNRMASHILKQHQFRALAVGRGWNYQLMGAYDDGRDNEVASKELRPHGLTAEFWIDELTDDTDAFNDAGIWNYVVTDQVRFRRIDGDTVIPLIDVPPLVLSEIMRDCDLFVGVASVGNDPEWVDGGGARIARARNYWNDYAFGDLSKVAETRKALLETLLPRLAIRDVAVVAGRFLEVQGTRHRYRIHIGSTNIQIMPDNRYLCIVPGRSSGKVAGDGFLPFEGDRGLSVILSKALMLARDDRITDPTILSQL